jgi:hypothetical protein
MRRTVVNEESIRETHEEDMTLQGDAGDILADSVTILSGTAQKVEAQTVTVEQSGVAEVKADTIQVRQGGIGKAEAKSVEIEQGGVGLVKAEAVTVSDGGVFGAYAKTAHLERSNVVFWRLGKSAATRASCSTGGLPRPSARRWA